MKEHSSRLSLGPHNTVSTCSEAELVFQLQKNRRPIADVSFPEKGKQKSIVSSARLGDLILGEATADPSITKTSIEQMPSFVIPFSGGGRINEGSQTITFPSCRGIVRYSSEVPLEIHTNGIHLVFICPSLAKLSRAIADITTNPAVAARLTHHPASVHSGQFGALNYHDQLVNLFSIIRNAKGNRDYLERIGIADILTRLLAEYVVAEAEQPAAVPPVGNLPRSMRAVDLICDHIEQHIGTPLTIPRMEKLTGLTGRALNYAFQSRFNCSPQEWQRNFLLDEARRRILRSSEIQSVKSVAFDLGFSSANSFARFYRRRFGEQPSDTISRAGAQTIRSTHSKAKD